MGVRVGDDRCARNVAHCVRNTGVLVLDLVALVQNQEAPRDGVAQRSPKVCAGDHFVRCHSHVEGSRICQYLDVNRAEVGIFNVMGSEIMGKLEK